MAEYLYEYLQQRFSVATMTTEWAYNIHDAFTRYSFDKYIALFAGIVIGGVSKFVTIDKMLLIFNIILTSFHNDVTSAAVTQTTSRKILKSELPPVLKSPEKYGNLKQSWIFGNFWENSLIISGFPSNISALCFFY